ncbi:unnamed protein product [Acanthoscelides obtectus]|uniref:Peptidase S1 domain-containing protein n=1 Tax=Acanthoscelides obtectus TaxID=200917 RepID=A0A9P0Q1T5_ACAOB|nr:unnamed protein product [Acanthoscelides obtectus]CAK1669456.1 Serine protease gd [Acanthoscelides obtectus]
MLMCKGYNGKIELQGHHYKEKLIEDVVNHRTLSYKVFFPTWQDIPPKVSKISVNGNLICSGPKISMHQVQIVTTVNLQHRLRVQVQPLSENSVPEEGAQNQRPNRIGNDPPRRFESNLFNFQPRRPDVSGDDDVMPGVLSNPFNFRPKMPKDPTKVYGLNPFFAQASGQNFNRPTTQRPQVKTSIPPQRRPEENNNLPGTRQTQIGVMPKINADTIPFEDTCGRAVTINQLVFHGGTVQKGAYPWLAALFWANSSAVSYTVSYKCSATLISQLHVVTAAHCVKRKNRGYDETLDAKDLLVKLGKLNIQEWTYSPGEKIIAPKSITVHPDYISSHSDADIAVLELIERIEFTTTIRPICLWSGPTNLEVVVGKLGTVVGWGMDENGNITTSEPRQVSLPVVSHEDCLSSSAIFATQVTGRTFCAGFRNGSGPCNGDSGSAFALQQNGRWMLRGIVSISVSEHATRHCDLSNYVIFTDASKYVDWLLSFFK